MCLTKCNKLVYCVVILWLVLFRLFADWLFQNEWVLWESFRDRGWGDVGGLSVSRETWTLWLACWSKTEAPSSCLCDGFWQAGVHWFIILLFFFSHTCLRLSGGMEEVVTVGSLIVFRWKKMWPAAECYEDRQLNKWHRRSMFSYSSWTMCAFL